MAFSAHFGHILPYPFRNGAKMEVMTIKGPPADRWHTDMTWMKHPPKATFLQCVKRSPEMETGGMFTGKSRGDTMFCSMSRAYDQLSPGLQTMLEAMTCQHAVHDLMSR